MTRATTPRMLSALLTLSCLAALPPTLLRTQAGGPADPAGDIEKLKEEVRQLKEQVKELRDRSKGLANHLTYAPDVEVQNEDYAAARSRFRTKLVRKGPSPQPWSPLKPPAGVTEVEYRSGELRLKAWTNRPADDKRKHPAVLYLHGGFSFDESDWEQSKPYRDAGFVVLTPLLRGENGQPGAFSYFYDEVDDVLAAADYLAGLPYVDAGRLFVAGHSVGGTMTLLAALTSGRFRAAAASSGAPFWPYFTEDKDLPFDRSDPREIRMRSPVAYAGSFKCPLRIYYGTEETWFFGPMSRRAGALAKRRGLDVEVVAVEGNHRTHVPRSLRQSIAFFQRISSQEIAPRSGQTVPLPEVVEVDLGGDTKLKAVRIGPGRFRTGSPPGEERRRDDEAQREAEIAKAFCVGVYPVTQAQFRQVMGMRPSFFSPAGDGWDKVLGLNTDDFPVESVTREEAMDFCRVASMLPAVRDKGWVVDLPTEAEWEYACRAGTETAFHWGNALSSRRANFNGNLPYGGAAEGPFLERTSRVGSYEPNARGLYDLHGNVLQWCKDWYNDVHAAEQKGNPRQGVARGGSWLEAAANCRAASRHPVGPDRRSNDLGFRVVVRLRSDLPR